MVSKTDVLDKLYYLLTSPVSYGRTAYLYKCMQRKNVTITLQDIINWLSL